MKKISFFYLVNSCLLVTVFLIGSSPCWGGTSQTPAASQKEENWVIMPAGGKPAYMGIHGGTMPVSLLVSRDGSSLFTFVGRTGNDFLEALRQIFRPFPSFGNATRHRSIPLFSVGEPSLFAGNATASLPVFALSGDLLSSVPWAKRLQPFGLSEEPLSIEGEAVKPATTSKSRKYRNFFLKDYLPPKKTVQ